ncbi:ISAs1 family transposase [Streptomyces phaeochromogenes]|uniref:ISAs1 family transposase n=1 Tax=Streptomyces phaeochromogenes TaxID=1923 RepID=UPI00386B2C72
MHAEIDGELLDLRLRLGGAVHPHRTLAQLQRVLSGGSHSRCSSHESHLTLCQHTPHLGGTSDIVVTFDALHSRTAHARFLVKEKKAHYTAVIKGNQRLLYQRLKRLPWRDVPLLGKTRATAHGRDEIRRVKTATVADLDFPRAAQAVQIVRRRRTIAVGAVTLERVFAVTGLAADQADAADIALRIRRHWVIENQLHHVRDTAWTEDASRVCTGTAPRVMASLRNRHRCPPPGRAPEYRAGLRHHARNASRPLTTLGVT